MNWISVEKELPKPMTEVFTFAEFSKGDGIYDICMIVPDANDCLWHWKSIVSGEEIGGSEAPTHWALPQPPE